MLHNIREHPLKEKIVACIVREKNIHTVTQNEKDFKKWLTVVA